MSTKTATCLLVCSTLGLLAVGCGKEDPAPKRVIQPEPVHPLGEAMAGEAGAGFSLFGGPMGERLVPRVRTIEQTTVNALSRIGGPSVPALVAMLQDPDSELRKDAAQALAKMGSEASQAVPELITALGDKDADVRKFVTHALGEIGPAAGDAVPALIDELRKSAKQAEHEAAEAAKATLKSGPFETPVPQAPPTR